MSKPMIARLHVDIKMLDADFRSYPCPRCGTESPRHDGAVRHAIDIGLDRPVVLQIKVGVYKCPRCRKRPSFRTFFGAPYLRRTLSPETRRIRRPGQDAYLPCRAATRP